MSCTHERLARLAVVVVALTWAFGGSAHAVDFEAAKRHYTSAKKHYAEKQYTKAAEQYRASYEITKDPAVLFDTGDAWEHVGDEAGAVQAVKYYRQYIVDEPRGAQRNEAEKRIAALEDKFKLPPPVAGPARIPPAPRAPKTESAIDAAGAPTNPEKAAAGAPSPATMAPVAPSTGAAPAAPASAIPPSPVDAVTPAGKPPEPGTVPAPAAAETKAPEGKALVADDHLTPLRKAAWGMVAASIALVTAGAILGLAAQERGDEITRQQMAPGPDGRAQLYTAQLESDIKQLRSEGTAYNAAGIALMSSAGATAVVAAVLFGVDAARNKKAPAKDGTSDKPKTSSLSILPAVSPRQAGISATIEF